MFRIMAYQETGEEICLENDISNELEALRKLEQYRQEHIEFYNFQIEEQTDMIDGKQSVNQEIPSLRLRQKDTVTSTRRQCSRKRHAQRVS